MYADRLGVDRWQGGRSFSEEIKNPTWGRIAQAIEDLDGNAKTTATLSRAENESSYLIIAGQWGGKFMVNATQDSYDFFSLVDTSQPSDLVLLNVGGQEGEYEQCKCVSKSWALEAAEAYFETGELKAGLNWVSDY